MTNASHQNISRIRLRAVSAAMTLAVVLGLGIVATQSAQAQTFTVLHNFSGSPDGAHPWAGLIRDAAGNLYGTTYGGGNPSCFRGCGVVFKVDTSGSESVLHSFVGGTTDGEGPSAGLVRDTAGNLYGTTYGGGSSGNGTVFKVDRSGTETLLHSFNGSDGIYPDGGLVRDTKGNLYGTTRFGGSSSVGTVFKVDTSGTESVLHSFTGSDGEYPALTRLLMDKKGNLYGVTFEGGTSNEGVVYKLNKNGTLTVLHSFAGGTADGCYPLGTPATDDKGDLYGTASGCGSSSDGIVWKISKKGTETVLHSFAGGSSDGAFPNAGVIRDAKGNLYGDADQGGSSNYGMVYKLSESGTLTTLHSFNGGTEGENPIGGLIRDAKGNLYGTTAGGGDLSACNGFGCGTVWKLTP